MNLKRDLAESVSDRLHRWYCGLAAMAEEAIGTEWEAYRWRRAEIAWQEYLKAKEREQWAH